MQSINVVFHINELDKWPQVISNINNTVAAVNMDSSNISVLANGASVSVFDAVPSPITRKSWTLNKAGVKIHVCRNSMKSQNIDLAALPDYVQEVPVGVLYLVARQSEGFAYIKP